MPGIITSDIERRLHQQLFRIHLTENCKLNLTKWWRRKSGLEKTSMEYLLNELKCLGNIYCCR